MNQAAEIAAPATLKTEHFDVLIVGAGISGVGGAYHLTQQCPGKRFVVLESQESFGGTWRTHRYPGIRSDSDLYTFGYRFKPWTGAPIATAEEILKYMGEVIEENDLGRHIRYGHRILSATWSSDGQPLDDRGERGPTPARRAALHRQLPLDVPGLLPPLRGLHPRVARHGRVPGADRPPADLAARTSTTRARRSSSSAPARPRRRWSRRSPTSASTSPCCSARPPTSSPAATRTTSPTRCASCEIDETGSTRSCAARSCSTRRRSPGARSTNPRRSSTSCSPGCAPTWAPDYDIETHFTPQLPALAPAHRLRPRRRPLPGHPRWQGLGRHRRDRALHRERHPAEVRRGTRGRHHRHRHRLQPERARRHRLRHRRQAARLLRHRHLPRHDVHRRAQHGLGLRLLPRQLDPARRPARRLRLPPAQPHGRAGARATVDAGAAAGGPRTWRCCPGSTRRTSTRAT